MAKKVNGFTLIEIIVVIAIIGILISLLPVVLSSSMKQARMTKCAVNLRTLGTTTRIYMDDYKRVPFAHENISYTETAIWSVPQETWQCHDDIDKENRPSYSYVIGAFLQDDMYEEHPQDNLWVPVTSEYENVPGLFVLEDREGIHFGKKQRVRLDGSVIAQTITE